MGTWITLLAVAPLCCGLCPLNSIPNTDMPGVGAVSFIGPAPDPLFFFRKAKGPRRGLGAAPLPPADFLLWRKKSGCLRTPVPEASTCSRYRASIMANTVSTAQTQVA